MADFDPKLLKRIEYLIADFSTGTAAREILNLLADRIPEIIGESLSAEGKDRLLICEHLLGMKEENDGERV